MTRFSSEFDRACVSFIPRDRSKPRRRELFIAARQWDVHHSHLVAFLKLPSSVSITANAFGRSIHRRESPFVLRPPTDSTTPPESPPRSPPRESHHTAPFFRIHPVRLPPPIETRQPHPTTPLSISFHVFHARLGQRIDVFDPNHRPRALFTPHQFRETRREVPGAASHVQDFSSRATTPARSKSSNTPRARAAR